VERGMHVAFDAEQEWRRVSFTWTTDSVSGRECILVVEQDISELRNAASVVSQEKERCGALAKPYTLNPKP
jgi:hypothetical protein